MEFKMFDIPKSFLFQNMEYLRKMHKLGWYLDEFIIICRFLSVGVTHN